MEELGSEDPFEFDDGEGRPTSLDTEAPNPRSSSHSRPIVVLREQPQWRSSIDVFLDLSPNTPSTERVLSPCTHSDILERYIIEAAPAVEQVIRPRPLEVDRPSDFLVAPYQLLPLALSERPDLTLQFLAVPLLRSLGRHGCRRRYEEVTDPDVDPGLARSPSCDSLANLRVRPSICDDRLDGGEGDERESILEVGRE